MCCLWLHMEELSTFLSHHLLGANIFSHYLMQELMLSSLIIHTCPYRGRSITTCRYSTVSGTLHFGKKDALKQHDHTLLNLKYRIMRYRVSEFTSPSKKMGKSSSWQQKTKNCIGNN